MAFPSEELVRFYLNRDALAFPSFLAKIGDDLDESGPGLIGFVSLGFG